MSEMNSSDAGSAEVRDQAPPPPAGGSGSDDTLMIVLSYVWLLCLIPFFTTKDDPQKANVYWHAKHGVVLWLAGIVAFVAVVIVGLAMAFIPVVGCFSPFLTLGVWLGLLVVHVICIVKAINGERFEIPGLTPLVDKF